MFRLASLYQKLRTNATLTDDEEIEVRRAMGETLNRLKAVEGGAAHRRDRRIVLVEKKKDIEKFIEVHEGLLSPIHRLLPEILQEIFWQCLPTAHNSVLSIREAPLVFGRVCSQWRQTAYSTPKLWSSLHITTTPLTPRGRRRLDAIDAWLTRSGILPLSISMSTQEWGTNQFRPYFNLILKYVRRWKCIHLQVEPYDEMDYLLGITAADLPLLEVFHFHRDPFGLEGIPVQPLRKKSGILCAPSLRALSINDASVRLLDLPVKFTQLTDLSLEAPQLHVQDTLTVLMWCPNLEVCVITVGSGLPSTTSVSTSSDIISKIALSKLRTLKIYGQVSQNSDFFTLLGNLSTPALRHLTYEPWFWSVSSSPGAVERLWSSSLNALRSFFASLNEPLQELDFLLDSLAMPNVMEFLYLFPELKRLSLRSCSDYPDSPDWVFNDQLLLGFIPYDHKSQCKSCSLEEEVHDPILPSFACLCPHLEVLNVNSAFVSKHILFELLHSRLVDYNKYNIARLRRFNISFNRRTEDEVMMEDIDDLSEKSGLPVKFNRPSSVIVTPAPSLPNRRSSFDGIREIFGVDMFELGAYR